VLISLTGYAKTPRRHTYANPDSEIAPQSDTTLDSTKLEPPIIPKIGRIYLKPELQGLVTVTDFDHPGATSEDCLDNPAWCVAWPDSDSIITNLPFSEPKNIPQTNPRTGESSIETYLHVKIEYDRKYKALDCSGSTTDSTGNCYKINHVDREGWINLRSVTEVPLAPLLISTPKIPTKPPCADAKIQTPEKKKTIDHQKLANRVLQDRNQDLQTEAEQIGEKVGKCPLELATNKSQYQAKWRRKNIYDEEVMPVLRKMKDQVPNIRKDNGKPMNWEDMVDIDALSRTLYSEMNDCFKDGVQFPMAAAKVAMNRVEKVKKGFNLSVFLKSWFHDDDKPTLAKVLTADRQFSVWNYMSGPKDKTILMSLCPTRNSTEPNWMGNKPSKEELGIWKQAVQIATQAVLHPVDFKNRTNAVKQLYYTSHMSEYDDRTRPHPIPTIGGRPVNSFKCMYLWNGT
jgi:hypothetical protein